MANADFVDVDPTLKLNGRHELLLTGTDGDGLTSEARSVLGTVVRHRIVGTATGIVIEEAAQTIDLAAGQTFTDTRDVDTAGRAEGGYACELTVEVDGVRGVRVE